MNRARPPQRQTFKKKSHLLESFQFESVFSTPDIKLSNSNIMLLARQTSLSYPRLGLVVAKKKSPLAVDRNKFKRLAREFFRGNQNNIGSYDVVILCRSDIGVLTKAEQNKCFNSIFSKLLKKNHV